MVDRNVRAALDSNAIKLEEVFDLIRSSEENGNQHIFYYKPKTRRLAEALNYEEIARRLWGERWEKAVGEFPAIRLKPNDYRYSDFRKKAKRPDDKNPKDWVLKVYGHSLVTRFTGNIEQRGQNTFWREYIEEPLRIVLLARWNYLDLLELRVQRNESRKRVDSWHNKLWEMLKPALVRSQFDEWSLDKSMGKLIREQQRNDDIYNFRDASIVDQTGVHATFQTESDEGDLFASIETRESIKSFLDAKSECDGLTVTWLKKTNGIPIKDMRTLLGANEPHEMVALAHCSSGELDYVTNQLRRFSR